ncbi:LLM class flavin-dependent oxidoreductase [Puerhibacterium puerhi]|uniref:LLM class flavin-dependent oxidoreductase n=1 Tax=Puerhibacterium puerhi TaxID=2692623 RepID=UPI00135B7022|nr:LLM class flavin-dependent oxidoreductase [Puerhibacterium puerhi]
MTHPTAARAPLSVLDLALVPDGGTGAQAIRDAVGLAVELDRLGYRRIWYAEHHLSPGVASASPAVLAAAVAARTTQIRVGSGAVLLSTTSPLIAAEQFGTIAALHPGRVDLGLGRAFTTPSKPGEEPGLLGDPRPRPAAASARVVDGLLVPPAPPVDLTDSALRERILAQKRVVGAARTPSSFREELELVLGLRAGTYADAAGTRYVSPPVQDAAFDLFVLASSGGESARVAGELGLPIAANFHVSPHTTLDTVAAYRDAFRPGVLAEPYVVVSADVLVADTLDRARELATPFADWVLSIRRGADGAIAYPRPQDATPWARRPEDERAVVADRVDTRIVGDPATVVERLETLQRATGADELLVTTAAHDPADVRRSFALLAEAWTGVPSPTSSVRATPALARRRPHGLDLTEAGRTRPHPELHPATTTRRASTMTATSQTPELQTPQAAADKVADGALLIDVRSAGGRASAGEIPGATHADRGDLDALFGPADHPAVALDTPVVVVCGSVDGSGPVAEALAARGYTNVSHVDGGFPAWKAAGLPATGPEQSPRSPA